MGAGKTFTMSVFSYLLSRSLGVPLFANYGLKGSQYINSLDEIWTMEGGIFCFDEIWLTMDARLSKNNVDLTRWINQTRKKKMLVMYTSQSFGQVDLRVRKATDFLLYAWRHHDTQKITLVDAQYGDVLRTLTIKQPERYYSLYDTFEVLKPMV